MKEIEYIGEHLLPGHLGHAAIVLSFVTSILAATAYFFATQNRDTPTERSWRNIARVGFILHGLSVFVIIATIFYIMINQYYEYNYVWAHVSEDLPFEYIASAFWEGQEGSFLLWMFWHVILGFVLIKKGGTWEAPVLATLSLIEVFISSMIQGVYIGFGEWVYKLGSSPMLLLRDTMNVPIFANADYLSMIEGTGLNPLLQNYWMTIHPPTLFLGFASTAIPFCFAIAGLWTGRHREWLKPVLPWALFSGGMLGTGILMGGAWAYEALSFGGYWAWDPVENMSLVPWLILLAGIHTTVVAKATGHSIKTSYAFYLMTFVMIVYSTFLTRSGVLGDTSVHAFTEMGLESQLLAFLLGFLFLSIGVYTWGTRSVVVPAREEATGSREFWMFIGSLVFLFSAVLITVSTSLPVYNKVMEFFNPAYEGMVIKDPEKHFNKYQLWIGIFIGLLSGITQFFRFREANWKKHVNKFLLHSSAAVMISCVLSWAITSWIDAHAWQYKLLLFAGIFTVVTNLDYLISFTKVNLKSSASTISHVGFGLMLIGIMASGLNKKWISNNEFVQAGLIKGFTEEQYKKNVVLIKGEPLFMNGYEVTYVKDTIWDHYRQFEVNYQKKDDDGNTIEEFNLYPNVLYELKEKKIAANNPSTKHYLDKDIFTHVATLPKSETDPEYAKSLEDSLTYVTYPMAVGDTLRRKDYILILDDIVENAQHDEYESQPNDLSYGARFTIFPKKMNARFDAQPVMALRKTLLYTFSHEIPQLNLKIKIPNEALDALFVPESELGYESFILKKGASVNVNGYAISFEDFNVTPDHPGYVREEGDVAVGAELLIRDQESGAVVGEASPVYLIRGKQPFNFKDELFDLGMHFRFVKINPEAGEIEILIGQQATGPRTIPIAIAEEVPRSDWIVLEAIIFPGINFFWVGTIMMMLGLFMGMIARGREKKNQSQQLSSQ